MFSTCFFSEFKNLRGWILAINKPGSSPLGLYIVMFSCMFANAYSQPYAQPTDDFPPLFPFVISYDGPDNASSMAHLLDGPAGKYGFIRVENGGFVNNKGPVRLHATNLTGSANFPGHRDAEQLAARLARFGINCVRLHYMDAAYGNFMNEKEPGIIAEDTLTQQNFSASQVDRLDYMIASFKKRGIYVNINLHVARIWDKRDGFTSKRQGGDSGVDNFEPRMIELQKEYARKLLTHANPYTGLAYIDDPCVAMVEINNENALLYFYNTGRMDNLPDSYASEFRKQWNKWLLRKYGSTEALLRAWKWDEISLNDEHIPEGNFNQPVSFDGKKWIFYIGSDEATSCVHDGVLKIDVVSASSNYPQLIRNLSVKKDQPYTLSFKIRRTSGIGQAPLGIAVADKKDGWRELGLNQGIVVDSTWKAFSYSFAASYDSDEAKLQLTRFKPGAFEIDDLSFQNGTKNGFDHAKRIEDGTIPIIHAIGFTPAQVKQDFYQFIIDTEHKYWVGLYDYLKEELNVKSVITGTQPFVSSIYNQAELDYIDNHTYWCHPNPVGPDWRIKNVPMVNSLAEIQKLAAQRVLNKPYTISEYNHPFPNQYGAEGQAMLCAYGRLQGWDGVFEYTYNHRLNFEPDHNSYFFSIIARTDVLAHFPACAAIFLRGDVHEARNCVIGPIDYKKYLDRLTASKIINTDITFAGIDLRETLIHKTAIDLNGKIESKVDGLTKIADNQKVFVSDTGELTWNMEQPGAGYWTVNTKNTKFFTGFPKDRTITLGTITLEIGKTRLDWATVSFVSRHGTGFGESGQPANILLAATGVSENKGMIIEKLPGKEITLKDWGKGPVYVEGIPAKVNLVSDSKKTRCFALDPDGNRKIEVPVEKGEKGGSIIVIKPEYKTVWYEIEIR